MMVRPGRSPDGGAGPAPARGRLATIAPWAAVAIVIFSAAAATGLSTWDEAWALQVAHRISEGDVLYRDVFFGATPLWPYVAAGGISIFGTHILVIKAIQALTLVGIAAVGSSIFARLTGRTSWLLRGAILVMPLFLVVTQYTLLAILLLLSTWLMLIRWRDGEGDTRALLGVGVAAGLCFLAKQNIGILALAAALLSISFSRKRAASTVMRDAGVLLPSFIAVVGLGLLPTIIAGGWQELLDYGFLNKEAYLRYTEGDSYFRQFSVLFDGIATANLRLSFGGLYVFLPLITGVAIATAAVRAGRSDSWTIAPFIGAAMLSTFPRMWLDLMVAIGPPMIVGLAWAYDRHASMIPRRGRSIARAVAVGWVLIGAIALTVPPVRGILNGSLQVSSLAHFEGILMPPDVEGSIRSRAERLRTEAQTNDPFLLMPDAGLYYLASGLRNPTPFDYALVTAMGRSGAADTVEAIGAGEIREACVGDLTAADLGPQRPAQLERAISLHMEPIGWTGACLLYRYPAR
jgi:4-amino-4-deoxy-L-arabinose transferase-like glycosyltransferase